jgi:hypothetical protein
MLDRLFKLRYLDAVGLANQANPAPSNHNFGSDSARMPDTAGFTQHHLNFIFTATEEFAARLPCSLFMSFCLTSFHKAAEKALVSE